MEIVLTRFDLLLQVFILGPDHQEICYILSRPREVASVPLFLIRIKLQNRAMNRERPLQLVAQRCKRPKISIYQILASRPNVNEIIQTNVVASSSTVMMGTIQERPGLSTAYDALNRSGHRSRPGSHGYARVSAFVSIHPDRLRAHRPV